MEAEILAEEVRLFIAGKVEIFQMAARLKSYRELLLLCYANEVFKNGLTPIEKLEPDYKQELWEIVKKDTAGLDKKECIEMAKIVYLISSKI